MDRRQLLRRQPDPLDVEAAQRLGDADHPRRSAGERPLDVAERAGAERVVVVLRRDERALAADERAEHVRVDEVRVEDVCRCRSRGRDRVPSGVERTAPRRGRARRRTAADPTVGSSSPTNLASTPRPRSAGSSVSRWRSEPPIPRIRWTWTTFIACATAATAARARPPRAARAGSPTERDSGVADEDHRRERVVGEERDGEHGERPRDEEEAGDGEDEDRGDVERLAPVLRDPDEPLAPLLALDAEGRIPEHPRRLRRQPRLLAGLLAPEVGHEPAVEAHLRALVDLDRARPGRRRSPPGPRA